MLTESWHPHRKEFKDESSFILLYETSFIEVPFSKAKEQETKPIPAGR
jgi:hypothetical protein